METLSLEANLLVAIAITMIIIAGSYVLEERGYCFKIGGVDRGTSIFIVILGFLYGFAPMLLYSLGFRSKELVINEVNSIISVSFIDFIDVGNSIIFNALLTGFLLYCGLTFILNHPNTNERTKITRARAIITVVFVYTIFGFYVSNGNIIRAICNFVEAFLLSIIACYNINWDKEMKRFKISFDFNVSKSILFIAMYNASVIVNAIVVQNLL